MCGFFTGIGRAGVEDLTCSTKRHETAMCNSTETPKLQGPIFQAAFSEMPTQIEVRFVELVMVVAGHGVVFGYTLVVALGDGDGGRHGGREEGWNPHKKRWLPVAREERAAQANGQRGAEGRREEKRGPVARFFASSPAQCSSPPLVRFPHPHLQDQ